ncbi:MAG: M20 family metallopeptidase [Bacteroidota bacterium]
MDLKSSLQDRARAIHTDVVALRRTLHANPELAFEEYETAALVQRELDALGIRYDAEVAKTGVVGYIDGGKEGGKTIALRGDMDALPIVEANEVDYVSQNPGKMHACGHDVHTSSLLGTAKLLQEHRDEFAGTIKLFFQPSEEKLPGGASVMIQEGVLQNPPVQSILGQHVMPFIDTGKIGLRSGMYMASADEIYLCIKGKGGHGAQPQVCIDPIVITAQIINACQTVVSRMADPRLPSVLSFGKVIAEGATNVIPSEVYLEGTYRTMNEAQRTKAHKMITDIIVQTARAMGGDAQVNIVKGYPVLHNDEALAERARTWVEDYVGPENVVDLDLWLAAEDFAWYTQEVPGCFYRLGTRNEARGIVHGVHTPKFDIDEEALALSTGLMAWLAINELRA